MTPSNLRIMEPKGLGNEKENIFTFIYFIWLKVFLNLAFKISKNL